MCGIAGVLNFADTGLEVKIQAMQNALAHRGPDDAGIYISSDRFSALAHTRLSILDLSLDGHQPMSTPDGRYHITFNGEIYNFRELRQNLIAQGELFLSQTDTEVILKLFQRHGADCVDRLRGMFAFAIWDDREQTCFLARDPLGIKPLYYWQSGSTLVFASEVKAVLASRLVPVKMSAIGLYGYLTSGSVPEPHTIVEGIRCLPAGHWLKWQAGEVKQHQYWEIQFGNEPISLPEAKEKVRHALIDSVKHHFVSDVPVGIFLSGGIDSTAVVALAHETQSCDLRTYAIAFKESEWNEGSVAKLTAQHFETKHTELCLTAHDAGAILPKFLESLDQPTIDGFNTFCVSQLAHNDGTKVVLSGLGGDEIFGGYKSFQKVPQLLRISQSLHLLRPIIAKLGKGLAERSSQPKFKRLSDYLGQEPSTRVAMSAFRGIFSKSETAIIARKYLPSLQKLDLPELDNFNCLTPDLTGNFPSLEDEVSFWELSGYMRNQLLRDSDVMSMAWGLELRVPFVDRNLLEAIATIPSHLRLASGKGLLTQALPELPEWVVNQPKRGFSFPFQKWMNNEWKDYFTQLHLPSEVSLNQWYRRWSLMILDYWWQQNVKN